METKYVRCIDNINNLGNYTIGKVYELDQEGYMLNINNRRRSACTWRSSTSKFIESNEIEYLMQENPNKINNSYSIY